MINTSLIYYYLFYYPLLLKINIISTYSTIQSGNAIDWDLHWNPRLSVENIIGEPKVSLSYQVKYDKEERATVVETRRINGQFFEFMELNQFPFDHQVGMTYSQAFVLVFVY